MANKNNYNWKKDKFTIIKGAISKEMAEFLKNYILLRRRVTKTFFDIKLLHPDNIDFGTGILKDNDVTAGLSFGQATTGAALSANYTATSVVGALNDYGRV